MREPLLHPLTLASMALLGLNDHWGKEAYPGLLTGKLSDFAGLVFFPLLLELPLELLGVGGPRHRRLVAVLLTALGFTAVKVLPEATAVWNGLFTLVYGSLIPGTQARLLTDPTDLVALSSLVLALLLPSRSAIPRGAP